MLTCKDFLGWLNDCLDDTADASVRAEVESHVNSCPNCWVVFDTSKKTLRVFRDMEPQELPADVHSRLMAALERNCGCPPPKGDGAA